MTPEERLDLAYARVCATAEGRDLMALIRGRSSWEAKWCAEAERRTARVRKNVWKDFSPPAA